MRLAKPHIGQRKQEVVAGITGILQRLLPRTPDGNIEPVVTRIVEKAVHFKNILTEEQVLYEFFWVDCGSGFEEERVDVVEEEPVGKVLLCTFPGLSRTVKEGDKIVSITVVKASGILESSFMAQS